MNRTELLRAALAIYCSMGDMGRLPLERAVEEAQALLAAVDEKCPHVFGQLDTATQNMDAEFTVCRTKDLDALVKAAKLLLKQIRATWGTDRNTEALSAALAPFRPQGGDDE